MLSLDDVFDVAKRIARKERYIDISTSGFMIIIFSSKTNKTIFLMKNDENYQLELDDYSLVDISSKELEEMI